jgi:threonylcarbamoyladenosine tRNA methylthiotransferase MtaB
VSGLPALSALDRAAFEESASRDEPASDFSLRARTGGVETVTLGCRLNMVESEELARQAKSLGETDLAIVNTCVVTAEALRRSRQAVRRLGRERPSARLLVTGCAATLHAKDFAAMPGVARVISNDDKSLEPAAPAAARAIAAAEGTRGFLAVQNGCDHRCTFCIIPFGRGDSRSAPPEEVLGEARALVASGKREIVLTGVDLTAYGADLGDGWTLPRLARMLLAALPEIARLRFSSIDCIEAGSELIDAMAQQSRLAPHLHLSLQSGDDLILKRMKRRHSRQDAVDFCRRLRQGRPETVLGADLIVGFPTETEAMFQRTLDLVEDCGLTHLHVFPFSPRPGAPAAVMPQVAKETILARAARLRALGEEQVQRHLRKQRGKTLRVLAERGGRARAEDFTLVRTPGAEPGTIFDVCVTGDDGRLLLC